LWVGHTHPHFFLVVVPLLHIKMSLSINTKGTAAKIVSEEIQHKRSVTMTTLARQPLIHVENHRYITVWNRTTEFDDGRVIQWDVVGHSTPEPTFCVVFTFDTKTVRRLEIA